MSYRALGSVCLAVIMTIAVGAQSQGGKPTETKHIFADYATGPPRTIRELWDASSLIVEATIGDSEPADVVEPVAGDTPLIFVRTAYRLTKVAQLKPPQTIQAPVVLVVPGGVRDQGNKIVNHVIAGFDRPAKNQRYFLFLSDDPAGGGYTFATHINESVFRLQGEQVTPLGRSPLSIELGGLSRGDFVARLLALARDGAR